ncbi:MAG: hypothetical protein Q9162_004907 [Coniocarpon cinnabarinum]
MTMLRFSTGLGLLSFLLPTSFATPAQYNLAPSSRTLLPQSIRFVNGTAQNPEALLANAIEAGTTTFHGPVGVTYDFGKNVGGIVSLNVSSVSDSSQFIGLTFTESSLWISGEACDATGDRGLDEPLWFQPQEPGVYTAPTEKQRGAFKYMSIISNTTGSVGISEASIHFTSAPDAADEGLGEYAGYFDSNNELLNRVWYAGAYTSQLCEIDPAAGDAIWFLTQTNPIPENELLQLWFFNATITNGTNALTDGAKRDRIVWPGDMSVAVPTMFVSTNSLNGVRNGLDSLFALQNASGQLPYAGFPIASTGLGFSFTYHLYSLIGLYNYFIFTGDTAFLQSHWEGTKKALNYSLSLVDETGLQNVTSPNDWLRFGMGGHNIEANAILYNTLGLASELAAFLNDTALVPSWKNYSTGIKTAANALLWDSYAGLYRDNDTAQGALLHPQDGNSWAVFANLTANSSQVDAITEALHSRWTAVGAPAPEAGDTVSPFISAYELEAYYTAGKPEYAVGLMEYMWGDFMLDDPCMTNSTFIEGYSTDGSIHYAPYSNDARISHAHGWSTGPTGILSRYAVGIQPISVNGSTWLMAPQAGNLTDVQAGFQSPIGNFSAHYSSALNGSWTYHFAAPNSTSGMVRVGFPSMCGQITLTPEGASCPSAALSVDPSQPHASNVEFQDLAGGVWTLVFQPQSQ